jgi:hypothetical protein
MKRLKGEGNNHASYLDTDRRHICKEITSFIAKFTEQGTTRISNSSMFCEAYIGSPAGPMMQDVIC